MNRSKKIIFSLTKRLHLDIKYFLKGSIFAFLQQIVGITCGLSITYLFGHFVTKKVFGEYNLILSILGMITFLSLPGLDFALIQSIAHGYDKSFNQSMIQKFKFSFLGIPILLGFSFYYFSFRQNSIALSLLIASSFFPFLNAFSNFPAFLTAKKKFLDLALISGFSSIFYFLIILASFRWQSNTVGITVGYLLALIIPSLIGFNYSKRYINKKSRIDRDLPKYGEFITFLSILPWISGNLGNFLLGNAIGVEQLALMAVASRFLTAVQKNFGVFYKPITARLAEQTSTQHLETIFKHSIKLLLIGCLLCLTLWITTPFLINSFFNKNYTQAIIYGQWLSLTLIPFPLTLAYTDMVIYQKLKKPQLIMSFVPNIGKLILFIFVIPRFGIIGLIFIILLERFVEPVIPLVSLLNIYRKNQ